jgi:uncharacterized BrkB/YihY/UPF0761 family membrane protein
MNENQNKSDNPTGPPEPRPLDYASGSYGKHANAARSLFQYILGFVAGVVLIGALGVVQIPIGIHGSQTMHTTPVVRYAGICVGALIGLFAVVHAYRLGRRHWFLAGFLTGICLTALTVGICYAIP